MKDDVAIGPNVHAIGPVLDAHAALALRNTVAAELGSRPDGREKIILVDVSEVTSASPAGVACLMQTLHLVRAEGADMRIFGVSQALETANLAYRIDGLTHVYKGLAEAQAAHPSGSARKPALHQAQPSQPQTSQPQTGRLQLGQSAAPAVPAMPAAPGESGGADAIDMTLASEALNAS
jgi:anti-anti-sigma regulatory factor